LSGSHTRVFSDNTTAVAYLNHQGGTRSDRLTQLASDIMELAEGHLLSLSAVHIRGTDNFRADFLSRHTLHQGEWMLNRKIFKMITAQWGIPQIDLFATRANRQVRMFASLNREDKPDILDALQVPWTFDLAYAFPPWNLLPLGKTKGAGVTKNTLSRWIREAIILAYKAGGKDPPIHVGAHSTRALSTSWAERANVPIDLIWADPLSLVGAVVGSIKEHYRSLPWRPATVATQQNMRSAYKLISIGTVNTVWNMALSPPNPDHSVPLSGYNSLTDKHLTGYFNNTRIRKQLQRAGLITRSGRILTEKEYRINAMRRDHQKYIRECLAQAIFHKVLDLERRHQIDVKRKLETFARKERVQRLKVDHSKGPEGDSFPAFSPRPPTGPKSGTNRRLGNHERSDTSESSSSLRPNTAPGNMQRPVRLQPLPVNSSSGNVPKMSTAPRQKHSADEDDQRCARPTDKEILRMLHSTEHTSGISPYRLPIINNFVTPVPPPPQKHPKLTMSSTSRGRRYRPTTTPDGPDAPAKDAVKFHKTSLHSNVKITMVYRGKNVHLSHEVDDYKDEIKVFQQHCGGENLCVFKGKLLEEDSFSLVSRRHRGFPFSLTFYINGIQVDRLSSCCEYKHRKGARLGGKNGYFGFINIEGASPCYRCIISMGLDKKPSPPPKSKTKEKDKKDSDEDDGDEEHSDKKEQEEDSKENEKRSSVCEEDGDEDDQKTEEKSIMDYEEEGEENKDYKTDDYEADDEDKDDYDEDFELEENKSVEKYNKDGRLDDEEQEMSKSPSDGEKDDVNQEWRSSVASNAAQEASDRAVDERDSDYEDEQGKHSADDEEMNSAARKIQNLYREHRVLRQNGRTEKDRERKESISSSSSVDRSSEDDSDHDDSQETNGDHEAEMDQEKEMNKTNPDSGNHDLDKDLELKEPEEEDKGMLGTLSEEHENIEGQDDVDEPLSDRPEGDRKSDCVSPDNEQVNDGGTLGHVEEEDKSEAEDDLESKLTSDEEGDCKSVQEKIAEAIDHKPSLDSEPEPSDSSTDEEDHCKGKLTNLLHDSPGGALHHEPEQLGHDTEQMIMLDSSTDVEILTESRSKEVEGENPKNEPDERNACEEESYVGTVEEICEPESVTAEKEDAPGDGTAEKEDAPGDGTAEKEDAPDDGTAEKEDAPSDGTAEKEDAPSDGTAEKEDAPDDGTAEKEDAPDDGTAEKEDAPSDGTAEKEDAPDDGTAEKEDAPDDGTAEKEDAPSDGTAEKEDAPSDGTAEKEDAPGEGTAEKEDAPDDGTAEKEDGTAEKEDAPNGTAEKEDAPDDGTAEKEDAPGDGTAEKEDGTAEKKDAPGDGTAEKEDAPDGTAEKEDAPR
ncbi:unnamed protein product, partial [Ranitomeya imitator]